MQVYLAHAGAASRRAAEKLITEGRVEVNGKKVTAMGEKVGPGDMVTLDGKPLKPESRFHYLVLNKPPEFICASSDPQGRRLALELLPPLEERLYNVGRLDYLSSGLILFTNDGDFAAKVSHPGSEIEKEYVVESSVPIPDRAVDEFGRGLIIEGVLYRALEIEKLDRKSLRVVLVEGKNREIRRVFSHFRLHPEKLQRVRIGPVKLGNLPEGQARTLTIEERKELSTVKDKEVKKEIIW
ncbi:pseudouridine synthase [Leadbettera azotonutricia]|uniref:Pseudouridine synthase n=1 Tax=Leadbettera azotonutricia (strain ATCC BAA-888 / DSM 13862 / ZAS-9) TaxID=545695 RepID=F5YC64_LEAAZ|nr:pseudouridine synthase [Leadbettera azotonutricia]AEF82158.1 ribosomal large subunit pseudouridine synthase F [Leadbettera azotonutricia ZAS-9]